MKPDKKYYHIALAGYCLIIFIESSIPGNNLPKVEFEFSDKIIHFLIYSILCLLFFYSLKNQSKSIKLQKFAPEFALLFTSVYGITDEVHQYFVPNRSCEFYDWVADLAGALVVYLFFRFVILRKKEIIAVIFIFIFTGCTSSLKKESREQINFSFTETEVWLNLMPGLDIEKNVLGFLISLNAGIKSGETELSTGDMKIYFDNDTLSGKKYNTEIFKAAEDLIKINISQSNDEMYIDSRENFPSEAVFGFNIYKDKKIIKSIKTPKLKINRVY